MQVATSVNLSGAGIPEERPNLLVINPAFVQLLEYVERQFRRFQIR